MFPPRLCVLWWEVAAGLSGLGVMQLMLQHYLFFFSFPPFDIIYHLSIWEENNMTTTTKCSKHKRPWDFVSNLIKQWIHKKIWCVWQNIHSGYIKWWHAKIGNSEKEMIGRLLKRGMKSPISVKSCLSVGTEVESKNFTRFIPEKKSNSLEIIAWL